MTYGLRWETAVLTSAGGRRARLLSFLQARVARDFLRGVVGALSYKLMGGHCYRQHRPKNKRVSV